VFKNSRQIIAIAIVFIVVLIVPLFFAGTYLVDFLIMTAIWVVFATSLRMLTTLGPVSFAHNGFLAIGAYTSAMLTTKLGFSFWPALLLSGVAAGTVALVVGFPLLRIKGHYFFLASVALGTVIVLVFSTQWRRIFGGPMGISQIPLPRGVFASPLGYYYLVLGWVILILAFVYRLDHCRIGMEWRAIRGVDDLAALLGIEPIRAKVEGFVLACFFAGISGSLYAHFVRFICPDSFGFPVMLACLTCVIVGGRYSTWGPVVGVLLLRMATYGLGGLRQWEVLIYSTILILCLALLPNGIVSLPQLIKKKIEGKKKEQGSYEPLSN
jgi:branched-chain amino acid transport system permease protein